MLENKKMEVEMGLLALFLGLISVILMFLYDFFECKNYKYFYIFIVASSLMAAIAFAFCGSILLTMANAVIAVIFYFKK